MKFYLSTYSDSHGQQFEGEKEYPHVEIVTDAWDDYYKYETLFRAYYYNNEKKCIPIGTVKIMTENSNITRNNIPKEFEQLDESFCSLGQDLEYYRNLKDNFKEEEIKKILESLNDCALNENIYNRFKDKGIFIDSLLRFSEAYKALNEAKSIIENKSYENLFKFKYKYKFDESHQEYEVNFDFEKHKYLPYRINALIGKNGVGKTNLLSNLASNLSGIKKDNGIIDAEKRPQFSKYIVISYNLFDDFNKPFELNKGMNKYESMYSELRNIEKRVKSLANIDGFYGKDMKLINDEIELITEEIDNLEVSLGNEYRKTNEREIPIGHSSNALFSYVYCGLRTNNGLITLDEMQEDLLKSIDIIKEKNLLKQWKSILMNIMENEVTLDNILDNKHKENVFSGLSSGQSILLFIISSIIANIEEESLLIFDEPEVHLHPNAICSFMKLFNELLEEFNSYAIVATHSPLIIQEVPSRYVTIFNKFENGFTDIQKLDQECFGENISNITNYVFDISEYESNYKYYFKKMINDENLDKEKLSDIFENNLSYNALLYINYLYNKRE